MKTEPAEPLSPELPDFSLILGGPLFQLLRRAHLSGDVADLVSRRVIALALITWLPLLALSVVEGHAWGDSVKVPFLFDVDVHARLLLWTRFLWQVSRIDLRLVAIHPDRAGGLGFLSTVTYAFAPLVAGQGVLLAGVMANKIFYAGAKLTGFKLELLAMVTMMLFFVLAPLLVFTSRLARTKRIGLAEYGGLSQRYVREFDQKWLRGGASSDEPLVGSADLQSLADLGNSFEIVKGMKPVPFGKDTLLQLAVISLAPVAPLVLTMIPLGELLDRFLHVVF